VTATFIQPGGRHPVVTVRSPIKRKQCNLFRSINDGTRRNCRDPANEPADESRLFARATCSARASCTREYMAMLVATYLVFHETHSIAATGLILSALTRRHSSSPAAHSDLRAATARRGGRLGQSERGRVALFRSSSSRPITSALSGSSLGFSVMAYARSPTRPTSFLVRQLIAEPPKLPSSTVPTPQRRRGGGVGLLLGGALFVSSGPSGCSWLCRRRGTRGVGLLLDVASPRAQRAGGDLGVLRRRPCGSCAYEPGLWARFDTRHCASSSRATWSRFPRSPTRSARTPRSSRSSIGVAHRRDPRSARGAKDPRRVRWGEVQRLCYFRCGYGDRGDALGRGARRVHSRRATSSRSWRRSHRFRLLMNASIVTQVIPDRRAPRQRASMYTLLAAHPARRGSDQSRVRWSARDHLRCLALGLVARGDDARQRRYLASPMVDTSTPSTTREPVRGERDGRPARRSTITMHAEHWPEPI